jgi:hypothetical protein
MYAAEILGAVPAGTPGTNRLKKIFIFLLWKKSKLFSKNERISLEGKPDGLSGSERVSARG